MLDLKALPVLRKNLDAFIRADPVVIVLKRSTKEGTAGGGWVELPPNSLAPQQFRLVTFKRRLYDFTAKNSSGVIQVMDYVLVGRVTVDIKRDDRFDLNGDHYKVMSIEPKTNDRSKSDRVVAEVMIQLGDDSPPEDVG